MKIEAERMALPTHVHGPVMPDNKSYKVYNVIPTHNVSPPTPIPPHLYAQSGFMPSHATSPSTIIANGGFNTFPLRNNVKSVRVSG